jgi:hypothetical protein
VTSDGLHNLPFNLPFNASLNALEAVNGILWNASSCMAEDGVATRGFHACVDTLRHLPPRRSVSVLVHPSDPGRGVSWAAGVGRYALFLARLLATEQAYCDGEKPDGLASVPFPVTTDAKTTRIVLPCTARQLAAAVPADRALRVEVAGDGLTAELPSLELRVHDGSTVWAPKAIVRLGVRCLHALWIAAARGRDVGRLTTWLRDYFTAFWTWTRRPEGITDEEHAARILALSHRIAQEARHVGAHPAMRLPRYPVHLRTGAQGFLALADQGASDLVDGPLSDVEAKLGAAYGLRSLPADAAPPGSVDHRIVFHDELPPAPDDPVILRASAADDAKPVRRGTRFVSADRMPEHLQKVQGLRDSRQLRPFKAARAWFHAVRRATECSLLAATNRLAPPEAERVRQELAAAHAELVEELWSADERERAHQVAAYVAHYFGQHLAPPLPPTVDGELRLRRGDKLSQAAIDWEGCELVGGHTETRGAVDRVLRFGVRDSQGAVRTARLRIGKGPPPGAPKLARALGRLCVELDWLTLDPETMARDADLVAKAASRADGDFFQDRARELDVLKGWLETIERDIGGDAERAPLVAREHISILQRAAQIGAKLSPFLTVTRLGNVTLDPTIVDVRYAYRPDTSALDVLGVLRTGLFEEEQPRILVSRGPTPPAWVEALRAAAGAAPDTVADAVAEFDRALETGPSFETQAWRAEFVGRLLRAASGRPETSRPLLDAVQRALDAANDMDRYTLVPDVLDQSRPAAMLDALPDGPEMHQGVTHWFTDDVDADQIVSIERPGLYERLPGGEGRWHVPPRVTMSAGRHTPFTREVQPVLQRCMQWLELAGLTETKRRTYVRLLKSRVLASFRALATEAQDGARGDAVARLLCDTRGLVAFLCHAGCRDVGVLDAVEHLAAGAGVAVLPLPGPGFESAGAAGPETIEVLVSRYEPDRGGRIHRGSVARPVSDIAGVALEIVRCLGMREDVDGDVREARVVADTLMSLADEASNLESVAVFLATKAHTLLPTGGDRGVQEADLAGLHAGIRRALEPLGLSLAPIQIGEDARQHDGRYQARPGSVNWRVTRVERPCLMRGERVIQLGLVATD